MLRLSPRLLVGVSGALGLGKLDQCQFAYIRFVFTQSRIPICNMWCYKQFYRYYYVQLSEAIRPIQSAHEQSETNWLQPICRCWNVDEPTSSAANIPFSTVPLWRLPSAFCTLTHFLRIEIQNPNPCHLLDWTTKIQQQESKELWFLPGCTVFRVSVFLPFSFRSQSEVKVIAFSFSLPQMLERRRFEVLTP